MGHHSSRDPNSADRSTSRSSTRSGSNGRANRNGRHTSLLHIHTKTHKNSHKLHTLTAITHLPNLHINTEGLLSGPAQQFIRPGIPMSLDGVLLPPPLPTRQYQQGRSTPQQTPSPNIRLNYGTAQHNTNSANFRIDADAEALSHALRLSQEEEHKRPGVERVQGLSTADSFLSQQYGRDRSGSVPSTRSSGVRGLGQRVPSVGCMTVRQARDNPHK